MTFESAAATWKASLVDVAENSRKAYTYGSAYWSRVFAGRDPRSLTVDDVQRAIAEAKVSPRTMRTYRAALRGILDRAKVDPNPARSALLRWPRIDAEEINPPEADVAVAIFERLSKRLRLPLVTQEQTGTRVGELQSLAWADVDEQGCRFRLRRESTKRNKARFVPVPEWLMAVIADTCPREDRTPERLVFQGFNGSTALGAMTRACKLGGLPHHTPHDWRHRRLSLWFKQGESAVQVSAWAGNLPSMASDTYGHVLIGGEIPIDTLLDLLGCAGDAPVMPEPLLLGRQDSVEAERRFSAG